MCTVRNCKECKLDSLNTCEACKGDLELKDNKCIPPCNVEGCFECLETDPNLCKSC